MIDTKKIKFNNPLQLYERNHFKSERKKNQFLIIHFNFIIEIPLKMNDIKKMNALQIYKRNPFKTEQTQKNQKWRNFCKNASQALCNLKVDF